MSDDCVKTKGYMIYLNFLKCYVVPQFFGPGFLVPHFQVLRFPLLTLDLVFSVLHFPFFIFFDPPFSGPVYSVDLVKLRGYLRHHVNTRPNRKIIVTSHVASALIIGAYRQTAVQQFC